MDTSQDTEPMAYIGKRPKCGCIVAMVVDEPTREREDIANTLKEFITSGLNVTRVTVEESRKIRICPHDKQPRG